mmetsp:Transcript_31909/g.80323  ORF Transcript_31909/g.80323 Transcript_31909/m.80323 type:complete len:202 (-) Transcript_31909:104-709(-)
MVGPRHRSRKEAVQASRCIPDGHFCKGGDIGGSPLPDPHSLDDTLHGRRHQGKQGPHVPPPERHGGPILRPPRADAAPAAAAAPHGSHVSRGGPDPQLAVGSIEGATPLSHGHRQGGSRRGHSVCAHPPPQRDEQLGAPRVGHGGAPAPPVEGPLKVSEQAGGGSAERHGAGDSKGNHRRHLGSTACIVIGTPEVDSAMSE